MICKLSGLPRCWESVPTHLNKFRIVPTPAPLLLALPICPSLGETNVFVSHPLSQDSETIPDEGTDRKSQTVSWSDRHLHSGTQSYSCPHTIKPVNTRAWTRGPRPTPSLEATAVVGGTSELSSGLGHATVDSLLPMCTQQC